MYWIGGGAALGVGVLGVLNQYPGEPGIPYELRTPMMDAAEEAEKEGAPPPQEPEDVTKWVRPTQGPRTFAQRRVPPSRVASHPSGGPAATVPISPASLRAPFVPRGTVCRPVQLRGRERGRGGGQ